MSGAHSRRKGRAWENAVVAWLRDNGHPHVERNEYLHASEGDILGIPGWVCEAKNHGVLDLPGWVRQAREEATEAGAPWYCVIAKRRGVADPGEAYVVMPLHIFADFVAQP